jgi:hypothetical protein
LSEKACRGRGLSAKLDSNTTTIDEAKELKAIREEQAVSDPWDSCEGLP